MRLICPNCGAQYEVDDTLIPEDGRDVQCSNCGNAWYQRPPRLGSELADDLGTNPELTSESAATAFDEDEDGALPPADGALPKPSAGSRMDASVRSILVEEAAREARARRGEPLEGGTSESDPRPQSRPVPRYPSPIAAAQPSAASAPHPNVPSPQPRTLSEPPAYAEPTRVSQSEADQPHAATKPDPAETVASAASAVTAPAKAPSWPASAATSAPRDPAAKLGAGSKATPSTPAPDLLAEASAASGAIPPASSDEAKPAAAPVTPAKPMAAAPSRRDLLPDIEEINSSLHSANERSDADEDTGAARPRGGFSTGFLAVVIAALIAVVIYSFAEPLSDAIPALRPALTGYVSWINELRIWLDEQARGWITAIRG